MACRAAPRLGSRHARPGAALSFSPGRGADRSGVRGLLDNGYPGTRRPGAEQQWRLDAETGYGFGPLGNGSLDTYTRLSAREHERVWSAGANYDIDRKKARDATSAFVALDGRVRPRCATCSA